MPNGDLLKLSQDFHDKMDRTFASFNKKVDGVVQSVHETEFEVKKIMADRPCSEVKAVTKAVDGHLEGHVETKRDVKSVVLSVLATVIGALLIALIFYVAGGG